MILVQIAVNPILMNVYLVLKTLFFSQQLTQQGRDSVSVNLYSSHRNFILCSVQPVIRVVEHVINKEYASHVRIPTPTS